MRRRSSSLRLWLSRSGSRVHQYHVRNNHRGRQTAAASRPSKKGISYKPQPSTYDEHIYAYEGRDPRGQSRSHRAKLLRHRHVTAGKSGARCPKITHARPYHFHAALVRERKRGKEKKTKKRTGEKPTQKTRVTCSSRSAAPESGPAPAADRAATASEENADRSVKRERRRCSTSGKTAASK